MDWTRMKAAADRPTVMRASPSLPVNAGAFRGNGTPRHRRPAYRHPMAVLGPTGPRPLALGSPAFQPRSVVFRSSAGQGSGTGSRGSSWDVMAEAAALSATTQPHSPVAPPWVRSRGRGIKTDWHGRTDMANLRPPLCLPLQSPGGPAAALPARQLAVHPVSMDMFSWRYRVGCKAARNPSSPRPRWGRTAAGEKIPRDREEEEEEEKRQGPGWDGSPRCWEACRKVGPHRLGLRHAMFPPPRANRSGGQPAPCPARVALGRISPWLVME